MSSHLGFPVLNLDDLIEEITLGAPHSSINKLPIKEIMGLVQTLKLHHYDTFQHSLNVSWLSTLLARKLDFCQQDILEISIGALLHDLGKMKVDPAILNKPGKLTSEEWLKIKEHPRDGVIRLSAYPWAGNLLPIVAYHHERVDGRGYIGLSGEIPMNAKMVCITDAFDAMISPRPYQQARPLPQCWEELEGNSGTQFEPDLVVPFISVTSKIMIA